MRSIVSFLAALLLVLFAAQTHAAQLTYVGGISIGIGTIPPITLTGSGIATVNNSGGGLGGVAATFEINQGDFQGALGIPVFNASPISGLIVAGGTMSQMFTVPFAPFTITLITPTGSATNGAGDFDGLDPSLPAGDGIMPLNGVVIVCLFGPCDMGPTANLVIPLTPIGQGGTVATSGAVNITAQGAPWTLGQATVGGSVRTGFQHGPASATDTAFTPSGVVSLVSPVTVSTSLATFAVVPVFAEFRLHFIPEPGTLLLLGAGVTGLAVLGRRQRRK